MIVVPKYIRNMQFPFIRSLLWRNKWPLFRYILGTLSSHFEVPIRQNKRLSIIDVIIKCNRSDINDFSLANLMFQNEVKHVVLMTSSTNFGINKEVTHNTRQNNKIVGTQYREIQTTIAILKQQWQRQHPHHHHYSLYFRCAY